MSNFLVGTSAYANADAGLLKAAGIGWIRVDFPFPFQDQPGGDLTEGYLQAREHARAGRPGDFR